MSQQKLLNKVVQTLESAKIQYMITGSLASSLQGEPRSTHDIDVVIAIQKSAIRELLQAFSPPDFYLEEESIRKAISEQSMFNLIDTKEGGKVDFWILTNEPFDQARFSRRYSEEFQGLKMQVSTPEDTILAKLRWAKLCGGSEKQFTDALRIYEVQFGRLDIAYLEDWIKKLNLEALWEDLKQKAEV